MLYTICIENIGAVMVTYFGKSTVCTIAVYVTLVPCVRQSEEQTVDHVSSFTESELYLNDLQFGNC